MSWTAQVKLISIQQQVTLKVLKEQKEIRSWKIIAQNLNSQFVAKSRTGKQCRERYMNFIRFSAEKNRVLKWEIQDDLLLFKNFIKYGSKWSRISLQMPQRSQNHLKNRFYGILRKLLRRISHIERSLKIKHRKPVRLKSLMNILQQSSTFSADQNHNNKDQEKLRLLVPTIRNLILQFIENPNQYSDFQRLHHILNKIHSYNLLKKSFCEKAICQNSKTQQNSSKLNNGSENSANMENKIENSNQTSDKSIGQMNQFEAQLSNYCIMIQNQILKQTQDKIAEEKLYSFLGIEISNPYPPMFF